MLPKDSEIVENKRLLLNHYSNQVKSQVVDMCNNNYIDLCMHLTEIAWDQKEVSSKLTSNWNELFQNFQNIDFDQYDSDPEGSLEEKKEESPEENQVKLDPEENLHNSDADNEEEDPGPKMEKKVEKKQKEKEEKKEEKEKKETKVKSEKENNENEPDPFDNPFD